MYAIIQTGGKQYKVSPGQRLKVEQLIQKEGDKVQFEKILLIVGETQAIGAPYLENCVVNATVVSHGRHDKIRIIKFRRRKHYKKQMGWRQNYTEVKIDEILSANSIEG